MSTLQNLRVSHSLFTLGENTCVMVTRKVEGALVQYLIPLVMRMIMMLINIISNFSSRSLIQTFLGGIFQMFCEILLCREYKQ